MIDLVLIRHGETDWNRQMRFQGHADTPLNARGRAQADRLALGLADEPIDIVVTSDLQRTRQTAQPLLTRRGLTAIADAAWREQSFGIFEGMDAATIRATHPDLWAVWKRHEADAAPPGGESNRQFHARVLQALRTLGTQHAGRRVAVVTHGGVLDMLWRSAHALPLSGVRQCEIPNTGVNRLRWDGEHVHITGWADAAHLDGLD